MQTCKGFCLFICAAILASASLYGCGNSKKSESIPSSATILYSHSVIFKNTTTLTMGYNGFGQLGDGTLTNKPYAVKVSGTGPMQKGAAGSEHTIVFGNNSSVMTWGYNVYGQLGASTGSLAYSKVPVKVPLHAMVNDVAAGSFHSLAVAGGKVYAWGYNAYGQLGTGDANATNQATPVPVANATDGTALDTALLVAAGGTHSLALLAGGSVYAWGNNASAQLAADPGTLPKSDKPVKVTFPAGKVGTIESIAAAGSFSLALEVVRVNGSITEQKLWGWGYNGAGQLGVNPVGQEKPYITTPVLIHSTTNSTIVKFAAGLDHILLLENSTVKAIGFNAYGQLGNDDNVNSFILVQTFGITSGQTAITGVTDIAAFGTSSFALVNGDWYGWGNNGLGQLGNPITTQTVGYLQVPTKVHLLTP